MQNLAANVTEPGILTVVLMGLGTVFFGIFIVILICKIILAFGNIKTNKKPDAVKEQSGGEFIKPDGELAAVIGAVVAEETGENIKNVKIVSVRKVR